MWRQNPFPATATDDSDQSFSDEEAAGAFDGDSSRNCVSLNGAAEDGGGVQILSQLEMLTDASVADSSKRTSAKKQKGSAHKVEFGNPGFGIESGLICSPKRKPECAIDEEMISDDEEDNVVSKLSVVSGERKGRDEMSSLLRRRLEASNFQGNSPPLFDRSSETIGGLRRKSKSKFSLGSYFQKVGPSSSYNFMDENLSEKLVCELPQNTEQNQSRMVGYSAASNLIDSEEEVNTESPIAFPIEAPRHDCTEQSIAELLDGLHERTGMPLGDNEMENRAKMHSLKNKTVAETQDSEDEPESTDSDLLREEEIGFHTRRAPLLEGNRQTLVDCFQEILDSTPWKDRDSLAAPPNLSSSGIFGRLQQVMQSEKEIELEYSSNMDPGGTLHCGIRCLHVLILSSYLDAKLTVCCCCLEKIPQELQEPSRPESAPSSREVTVIFSPRMCSNVDIEAGKVICISPPWKSVRLVGDNDRILLATCFSRVSV